MAQPTIAPYGTWESPITADLIVAETIGLGQIVRDGADIYWAEMRPQEKGRYVVVRYTPDGQIADVNPAPFSARTRVHEYGGGAYTVHDGTLYFTNFADQRLYRQQPGGAPEPLTPEGIDIRFADCVMDSQRNRLIGVREDHRAADREAVNTIAALDLGTGGAGQVLISGSDFFASPRLSPDGTQLVWQSWNHPNMPWDGCELWLAPVLADGSLGTPRLVAGGAEESIFQPQWSPDGTLYFVSDRSGWWNLYRLAGGEVEPATQQEAEFGAPQWVFGQSTYGFAGPDQIVCTYTQDGFWHLAAIDTRTLAVTQLESPYTVIHSLQPGATDVVFEGGSPTQESAIVRLDLMTGVFVTLRHSGKDVPDTHYISPAQPIAFPTADGQTAYGFYYPPYNADFVVPVGDKPPLLVISHGGPTGATDNILELPIQFWTSRGFAVLDVNYGGSTGYGRAYRMRLNGRWGVVDIDDCCNGALYLAEQGEVDPQ
ncbi:MAG: prolyl oligopeptidase family serine peptidase, partial [Chloroflexi bacterium]|nr:prolyl oligopeptidase family serine peptidase [Chloroflexota bacterium]